MGTRSALRSLFLGLAAIGCLGRPAPARDFTLGDLYLLTAAHPDPEVATGILHIVPETGAVSSLGAVDVYAGIFAYDPFRDRLLGTGDDVQVGLTAIGPDGACTVLTTDLPTPAWIAPRGDGIIYAFCPTLSHFEYVDAADGVHLLLDESEEVFGLDPDSAPTELLYDFDTNSLLVLGGTDSEIPGCPDPDQSCVLRVPLSDDGTRVVGDPQTLQVDISSTWEHVVGTGRLAAGGVLWVADTNSNNLESRMQLLDPAAMSCVPYAANGAYTGAAATNAGTYSNRLGCALILDTYNDRIAAFAYGQSGYGTTIATEVSDAGGAGETARLVEIYASPFSAAGETSPRPSALTAAPNPFRVATQLQLRLATQATVDLAIVDLAGRHLRTLARAALPAGTHSFAWDGRDARGLRLAQGVYLARLEAATGCETRKLVLLR